MIVCKTFWCKWPTNFVRSPNKKVCFRTTQIRVLISARRLTWNLRTHRLKRKIVFQTIIFRFYVNLRGCRIFFTKEQHAKPRGVRTTIDEAWIARMIRSLVGFFSKYFGEQWVAFIAWCSYILLYSDIPVVVVVVVVVVVAVVGVGVAVVVIIIILVLVEEVGAIV